jgi:chromosome partitioning protein
MKIVSVINYKGGVGKTTVTANLGAELAYRGRSVLLVDADPQASLTFSFYNSDEWFRDLAPERTIKNWFDGFVKGERGRLADSISTPLRVAAEVEPAGGRLDLIASHLDLVDIDLDLAAMLGGSLKPEQVRDNYLRVHRQLVDGLAGPGLPEYDFVLIDCAPNFGFVTRTAIVASDHILIPAKADELSTLGIPTLRRHIERLTRDFNWFVGMYDDVSGAGPIGPNIIGALFTMVGLRRGIPYLELQPSIAKARTWVTVFDAMVRESKSAFASAARGGVPVVLAGRGEEAIADLERVADEFLERIEGGRR